MFGYRTLPCLAVLLALASTPSALARIAPETEARQVSAHHWQNVSSVVAFGDVHGAYQQLHDALLDAGLIDENRNWTGGSTHLVSLGDLLDRGADSRKVMDLLMRLQEQAIAAGGRVHVVLGNHEVMNLTGDLRYVAPGEYTAFADPNPEADASEADASDPALPPGYANHRSEFGPAGHYGRWLLQLPLLLQIDQNIFVHGGLPPLLAEQSIADVNKRFRAELADLLALSVPLHQAGLINPDKDLLGQARALVTWLQHPDNADADSRLVSDITRFVAITQSDLFGWKSPNWYRGTAKCAEPVEDSVITAALAKQAAARVVMGHTPTSTLRVQKRFGTRALLADTGMLKDFYHGQASLVFIRDGELSVQYPEINSALHAPDPVPILGRSFQAIESLFMDAPLPDDPGSEPFEIESVRAVFERGNAKTNKAKVAAYRLSELLGWHLVPVTVDRGNGVLIALPRQSLTEAQRIEAATARPNHCAVGNAYQLMYAFDTLLQNNERTAESIVYDQSSWRIFLFGHGRAFGRGRSIPGYLAGQPQVLPEAVIKQLQALTAEQVLGALSPLVSEAQVKTLMKRRDAMLRDWEPLSVIP